MFRPLLSIVISMSVFAQVQIEQQPVIVQDDGNICGEFKVALRVKGTNLTAANTLGSATVDLAYSPARLRFPTLHGDISLASRWNPALDGSAYTRMISNPGAGFVRVILAGGAVNNGGGGAPAGFDLSVSQQTLVTLTFRIVDTSQAPGLGILANSNALSLFSAHNNSDLSWNTQDIPAGSLSRADVIEQPSTISLAFLSAILNPDGPGVRLDWETLSETNNQGFYVQRRADQDSLFVEIPNSFQAGHGTTTDSQAYSFVDTAPLQAGRHYYRLRHVDSDGTEHFTSGTAVGVDIPVASVAESAPLEFKLFQNYPNPFNPMTEIKFSVEKPGRATVRIYSITGQEVAALFDAVAEAGRYYTLNFDAHRLATGVYFYKLDSGQKTSVKKMLLLK